MTSKHVACALVALWLVVSCTSTPAEAPPQLMGVWETQSPGYEDQHIFIDRHRIGFGTSAVDADGYVLTDVREEQEGSRAFYVLTYQGADQSYSQLAFYYEQTGGGLITFKNQDHLIWTKKSVG